MRLKVKLVYKCSEEMAHRQAEAAFEVCGEDHPFPFHRIRGNLVPRESASNTLGNPPRLHQPVDFKLGDSAALPVTAADTCFGILSIGRGSLVELRLSPVLGLAQVFSLTVRRGGGSAGVGGAATGRRSFRPWLFEGGTASARCAGGRSVARAELSAPAMAVRVLSNRVEGEGAGGRAIQPVDRRSSARRSRTRKAGDGGESSDGD